MHTKFIVVFASVSTAYLFLSLCEKVNWIAITVIVSLVVIVLIIYSIYQIVGLYYYNIFRNSAKQPNETLQANERKSNDKESGSRMWLIGKFYKVSDILIIDLYTCLINAVS